MASNASLVIADGATSPANHTFDPAGINGITAKFQNRAETLVTGRETLQLSLKSDGKAVRTVTATLKVPYVVDETMNAVTNRKVASFFTAKLELLVPVTWTPTQARAARGLIASLVSHQTFRSMVEDDEFVW